MPVVEMLDLSGDARQRGEAHGEAMRDDVAAGIDRWRNEMNAVQPMSPSEFIRHIQTQTQFFQTVDIAAPDLMDEVRGIAAGANLDFETVFAFQLLDECWWLAAALAQDSTPRESCSSLAFSDVDGAPLAAQTMDLPQHYDRGQLLLRFTDPQSGIRQIVFTAAGLIGLNGVNSNRLAVCVNTLSQLACSRAGLPVAFVLRSLLATPDPASATEFVERTQHASGQNYVIATPDGIIDIEAGAESITRYSGTSKGADVYHTNHVLAGPLAGNKATVFDEGSIAGPSSTRRLAAMTRFFEQHPQPNLNGIKTLLSSADGPICAPREPGHGFTFGACIMTLGTEPALHVTHGPPTVTSFVAHSF